MNTIGVLALQGDFAEHADILCRLGARVVPVKRAEDLHAVEGLIIPGGESTAIAKLTNNNSDPIFDAIIKKAHDGMPIYGTCMGLIFLAKEIEGSAQGRLGLMDIKVRRNAFGPQKYSREEALTVSALGEEPFPAVFIRGPIILAAEPEVEVLAKVEEGLVMCRQDNLLVTAFHPELTGDYRVHAYFLDMVKKASEAQALHVAGVRQEAISR